MGAENVARDVGAGITEQELREKYKLADHRVRKLLKRLAAAGAITGSEWRWYQEAWKA
jgi:DNA-binding GntR family transcriptional regulator